MGSFNDWEDDQDSFYDWGSQFGKSKVEPESNKKIEVAEEPEPQKEELPLDPQKEEPHQEPVKVEVTTETPDPSETPASSEETEVVEKLSADQRELEEKAKELRENVQRLIPMCSESQLPKGLRTIIKALGDIADTAVATWSLADFYLESVEKQRFVIFKESGLKSTANSTLRIFNEQDFKDTLSELEDLIKKGEERVILNLRTRIIKDRLLFLRKIVQQQAKAYSKAIGSFHPDKGALPLLERFAEKGNKAVMASIDNTLQIAGTSIVMVEDAPALQEALDKDDTDTIIRLQQKLIDYIFDEK